MSTKIPSSRQKRRLNQLNIELHKKVEDPILFQERRDQVQVLLTDMFLRLKQKGRPSTIDEDEQHAA